MTIYINDIPYTLDGLITKERQIISIGKKVTEVNNSIALDGDLMDVFQCQITRNGEGRWLIHNGQYRTECPRGLLAARDKACTTCRGCCVNISIANPKYSWRTPLSATLLNDHVVEDYVEIKDGDKITICLEGQKL